jgi:hypothetical protein
LDSEFAGGRADSPTAAAIAAEVRVSGATGTLDSRLDSGVVGGRGDSEEAAMASACSLCVFLLRFFCRDASNSPAVAASASTGADIAHGGDKNQAGGIETGTASALGGGPAA